MRKYLSLLKQKLFPPKDFEVYEQSIIPSKRLRPNGVAFKNTAFYIQSAEAEAQRVINRLGCNKERQILEIGCGKGRFVTGLLRRLGAVEYTGLDVHQPSIKWCQKYIENRHPSYHFKHIDIASQRYHKNGKPIDGSFKFNIEDKSIDLIYLWGVFTNMDPYVMKVYLNDMKRMLSENGKVFFTAFVEENVPGVSINPEGYIFKKYNSPLHVVRYEKKYIASLISEAGLAIDVYDYGTEFLGQSAFYLSKSRK